MEPIKSGIEQNQITKNSPPPLIDNPPQSPPKSNLSDQDLPLQQKKTSPPKHPASSKDKFDWSLCPTNSQFSPATIAAQPLDKSAPINIYADRATIYQQDTAILSGNVNFSRPGELLETPWLIYDFPFNTVQTRNGLRYQRSGLILESATGFFDLESNYGELTDANYHIATRHAQGRAATIRIDDRNRSSYTDATYSTCPRGQEDWLLSARSLDLDQNSGRGIARHVTTYFQGVPFFYLPYLSFPISGQRESGFLIPTIGNSSRSGLDLRIPYYWNIAPNYDATFTLRLLTRRGMQLNSEWRYLTRDSNGQINLEVLPRDQLFGSDRGLLSFHHNSDLSPRVHTKILFGAVSDDHYFHDLGNTLALTSLNYLERRAELLFNGDGWFALGRVQGFQTLDGSRPFERLPQLQVAFDAPKKLGVYEYNVAGELTNFSRSALSNVFSNQNYAGTRLWLQSTLAYPVIGLPGFFIPRLTFHQVNYTLQDTAPGFTTRPNLSLPIFSLDTGIFLDRQFTWGSRNFVQTLEPRLYYLYVPYQNQTQLPIFDTTLLDFSFGQLFRENRFSGPDRIGDANQIAFALTSRLLENGTQFFYGSLGQIIYFRDRLVTLDYGSPQNFLVNDGSATGRSDVIAELGARIGKYWTGSATVQWNQQQGQPEKRALRLRYQSDPNHIVNFSLRNRRDLLEQVDLFVTWPITRQWNSVARWNYSLRDDQILESFAGIRYDSCCWGLQFVSRRYISLPGESPRSDVMLQLELKGLANLGEKLDPSLTNNILGNDAN